MDWPTMFWGAAMVLSYSVGKRIGHREAREQLPAMHVMVGINGDTIGGFGISDVAFYQGQQPHTMGDPPGKED